ncbi:MAG TPA: dihydroorotate dehydrogenase electron transfer subunit [Phycisphaerae bacterium]|nr:dihydroorotate dehydrogenase electron transfer subunit [Phycisphaerae bacterium]
MSSPAPTRSKGAFAARVLANRSLGLDHYRLRLGVAGFPRSQPGQFINVRCGVAGQEGPQPLEWPEGGLPRPTGPELAGVQPLLRRPFSLAGRVDKDDGTVELDIIHHVVGVGTARLAELGVGAEVSVIGPLGRGFTVVADRPVAALVGGGVGVPPLLYLAETLQDAGVRAVAFAGARTARALPLRIDPSEPPSQAGWPTLCTAEFAARHTPTVVATDDGSLGVTGFVDKALLPWLDSPNVRAGEVAVYACGPAPMIKAVADIAAARAMPCQLALERHMACGMGTCQGCAVKVKAAGDTGWAFQLVCKDGPVFDANDLYWE